MSAGKGDNPRPVNGPKYRANFDLIFPQNNTCALVPVCDRCQQTTTDANTPSTPAYEVTDDGNEF